MNKEQCKKINIEEVSKDEANDLFKIALVENLSKYSYLVMSEIKKYKYSKMARELDISTNAVHKWFKESNIPKNRIKIVSEKLNLKLIDFELVVDSDVMEIIEYGE